MTKTFIFCCSSIDSNASDHGCREACSFCNYHWLIKKGYKCNHVADAESKYCQQDVVYWIPSVKSTTNKCTDRTYICHQGQHKNLWIVNRNQVWGYFQSTVFGSDSSHSPDTEQGSDTKLDTQDCENFEDESKSRFTIFPWDIILFRDWLEIFNVTISLCILVLIIYLFFACHKK